MYQQSEEIKFLGLCTTAALEKINRLAFYIPAAMKNTNSRRLVLEWLKKNKFPMVSQAAGNTLVSPMAS